MSRTQKKYVNADSSGNGYYSFSTIHLSTVEVLNPIICKHKIGSEAKQNIKKIKEENISSKRRINKICHSFIPCMSVWWYFLGNGRNANHGLAQATIAVFLEDPWEQRHEMAKAEYQLISIYRIQSIFRKMLKTVNAHFVYLTNTSNLNPNWNCWSALAVSLYCRFK